jgi:superfamily II DNA helicase RecQ
VVKTFILHVSFIQGTGTATSKVIQDIRDILRLDVNNAPCILGTFNRENISYEGKFVLHESF